MKRSKLIKILLVIFICILFIGLYGCKKQETEEDYYTGTAITKADLDKKREEDLPAVYRYKIRENDKFSATYTLDSHQPKKTKYLITALLDYKQTPIEINNKKSLYSVVEIPRLTRKRYPFSTDKLNKGFYDFTILAFQEPFNSSTRKGFRWRSDGFMYYPQRPNLVVDDEKPKKLVINTYGETLNNKDFDRVFIMKNKSDKYKLWSVEKTPPGNEIKYYVHVGNISEKVRTFALLLFLDYKQIPAKPDKPIVLFGKINKGEKIIIPASFNAPDKKGVHELFAIMTINPFAVQSARETKDTPIKNYHFFSTIRTAIVVE